MHCGQMKCPPCRNQSTQQKDQVKPSQAAILPPPSTSSPSQHALIHQKEEGAPTSGRQHARPSGKQGRQGSEVVAPPSPFQSVSAADCPAEVAPSAAVQALHNARKTPTSGSLQDDSSKLAFSNGLEHGGLQPCSAASPSTDLTTGQGGAVQASFLRPESLRVTRGLRADFHCPAKPSTICLQEDQHR